MGACGLALLGLLAPAGAQEVPAARSDPTQRPVAFAARRPDGVPPPVIDGRLDDPAWEHAAPLSDLRQVESLEDVPPGERTQVLLLHDSRAIYVRLPAGDFVVHVASLELTLVADPDLSWTSFLQFDDQSDALALDSRAWWILRPGSSAFLVLDQGWRQDQGWFAPLSTEVEFKLGVTLRL